MTCLGIQLVCSARRLKGTGTRIRTGLSRLFLAFGFADSLPIGSAHYSQAATNFDGPSGAHATHSSLQTRSSAPVTPTLALVFRVRSKTQNRRAQQVRRWTSRTQRSAGHTIVPGHGVRWVGGESVRCDGAMPRLTTCLFKAARNCTTLDAAAGSFGEMNGLRRANGEDWGHEWK